MAGDIWRHLEAFGKHLGGIWKHLEASGGIWRHLGGIWEASGKHLGSILEASGDIWKRGASGMHLEAFGKHLGGIWKHFEASGGIWRHLGGIWEASGKHLEASGRHLGCWTVPRRKPPEATESRRKWPESRRRTGYRLVSPVAPGFWKKASLAR